MSELAAIVTRRPWNSKEFDSSLSEKDHLGQAKWLSIQCPRCKSDLAIPINWHEGIDGKDYHPKPTPNTYVAHTKLVRKAEVPIELRPSDWDTLPEGAKIELPCVFLYREAMTPLDLNKWGTEG